MAIRINSSFFKLWGIRRCSSRIAKIVNHADRPAVLYPTSKGLKLVPLHSENTIDIGFKKLSAQLMPPLKVSNKSDDVSSFEGQILLINPSIKGGQLKQCLRSLIKQGLNNSGDILKENGIRVRPDIKTTEDLANYLSDRLKNKLFSASGSIDGIRAFANDIEARLNSVNAAVLLGKDINGITGSISNDINGFPLLPVLTNSLTEYSDIINTLFVFPHVKRTGNSEQEYLTIKELSSLVSDKLKISHAGIYEKSLAIRTLIEDAEKKIVSMDARNADAKINEIKEDIANLRTILSKIERSVDNSIRIIDDLAALSARSGNGSITWKSFDKAFIKEALSEDRSTGWPNPLPQISKEIAGRVSILVVDDEPGVRICLERSFKELGFWVTMADCGEFAMEVAKNGGYDIVYSDFLMPGMDGVDFLKAFRKNNKDIPVFIISSLSPEHAPKKLSEFINSGNARYIAKDITNMNKILRPAIEAAQIKAGIAVETSALSQYMPAPAEDLTDFQVLIGRLTHKLNNSITGLLGMGQLMHESDEQNSEDTKILSGELEKCRSFIEQLAAFTKEFRFRPRGDMELLPKELKIDKSTIEAINTLSSGEECEYNKIGGASASLVILYSPVIAKLSEQIALLGKTQDRSTIDRIIALTRQLKLINDSLVRKPENEEMELASKTLEYILKEK